MLGVDEMKLLTTTIVVLLLSVSDVGCQELQNPHDAEGFVQRGHGLLDNGNLEGAIRDFSEAIRLSPDLSSAHAGRGKALLLRRDVDGAIRDLSEAIRLNPERPRYRLYAGHALRLGGKLEEARQAYDEALRLDPADSTVWMHRGSVRAELGDLDGAMADSEEAIRITPGNSLAWSNLGCLRARKGDAEGALKDLTRAVELDPDSALAAMNLGGLHYDRGSYGVALKAVAPCLEKASPGEERDYAAILALLCRLRLREAEIATPAIEAVFEGRDGKSGDDWPAAIAAFLRGRISEEGLFEARASPSGLTLRERECEAWFYAGTARLIHGDSAIAKEYFEKCVATGMSSFSEYLRAKSALARWQD